MKTRWSSPARLLTAAWLAALLGGASSMEPAEAAEGVAPAPSIASLRERAAAGAADAQYDLGVAMVCRRGLARDPGEAARLLRGAAEQGHVGAQSVLGWMLMSGHGVPRNDMLAAGWLQRAAEAGDTAAQNNLGVLYATGQGVAHDDMAAERWFRAAADQGAEIAAQNLTVIRGGGGIGAAATRRSGGMHPALAAAGCRAAVSRS
jgi:TPR repeat protein